MKQYFLLGTLLFGGILGCKNGNEVFMDPKMEEAQKLARLQEQFHGKYKIVSSIADQEVDINMDGARSTNLLTEIPDFRFENHPSIVELRIYGPSPTVANSAFLLSQGWPEQYVRNGNQEWDGGPNFDYKEAASVSYANQGTGRTFKFSDDLKEIIVERAQNERPFRWVAPESVKIDVLGRLEFVNKRYLYTKEGVKQVTIQTVYERFTKET